MTVKKFILPLPEDEPGSGTLDGLDAAAGTTSAHETSTIRRPRLVLAYLLAGFGLLALGMGLVPALATSFRAAFHLTGAQVANVHNLKDIGLVVAMLAGPALLRRLGASRAILAAIGVGMVGCAVYGILPGYPAVLAGAFLHGAAFALGSLVIMTYLFQLPARYRYIAATQATFGVASFVAPVLVAGLVQVPAGYGGVYGLYAGALLGLAVAGLLLRGDGDGAVARRTGGIGSPSVTAGQFRAWLPGAAVFATIMAAETIVVSWITFLAQYGYGASLAAASALLATLWAVHAPARAMGDVLARRFSAPLIVFVGTLIAALGIGVACLGSMPAAYAGVLVFTLGIASLIPVHQGWMLNNSHADLRGSLNSLLGVGAAGITTILVWLTGLAVDINRRLPFAIAIVLLLVVAGWALSAMSTAGGGTRPTRRSLDRDGWAGRGHAKERRVAPALTGEAFNPFPTR
ncbi:hypothetical protein KIF24_17895 [Micromonospora sp. Llam7]|uniref:MFS transporter n=1 Tax=Micromonospora tarapacensis TaxID=2835305 RepID=UPI001C829F93|nr:MFS transporter [Micromonospora tarapacensis]MBX7267729.1 hypothetical protein [Micromonospora tarapacensis]